MKWSPERTGVSLAVGAAIALIVWPMLTRTTGMGAIPLTVLIGAGVASITARRLPGSVDGVRRRRRSLVLAWTILVVGTLIQLARLGAYMGDPSRDWWLTTRHEFWSKHACMAAYFYAADLNRQGEPNVYAAEHYPGLNPGAESRTTVANLVPDDPYQYPPQFLLLPRLAIALSSDFLTIRAVWYSLQVLFFLAAAFLVARWYGGTSGAVAAWLIPLVLISVPALYNFQYGQFHLTTIALGALALVAFQSRRDGPGGGLLAAAILAKGFPAIVLVPLVLQRRWRAVAWTGAWSIALTVVAVAVLGTAPFEAFVGYHLPRVQSGAAFAFDEVWPDLRVELLAGNVSPFATVRKLGELGLAGLGLPAAKVVHGIFGLTLIGLAALAARIRGPRRGLVAGLALVNLAAMAGPAAWGDYVPVGTLWMLTLLVAGGTRRTIAAASAAGGFCFLVPGVVPYGSSPGPALAMALSVVATLVLVIANGEVIVRAVPLPQWTARW